jgi:hypothetical protein
MPRKKILLSVSAGLLLAAPSLARPAGLHWEKLHVTYAEPSEVFARLGLTHSTRFGHTLGQKRVPDPGFPPGLTDVIPYDPGHTLLVRGTAAGVAQFRLRVAAADVPAPRWQVTLTLTSKNTDDGDTAPALAMQSKEVTADVPAVVSFNTDGQMPQYQITLHMNRDGTLAVTRRTALSLSAPPPGPAQAAGVFVPSQVWTAPISEDMRVGDTLSFDDLAADRAAALQQLGPPGSDQSGDYQVEIQVGPAGATP